MSTCAACIRSTRDLGAGRSAATGRQLWWDGLITNKYQMLRNPIEIAAAVKPGITGFSHTRSRGGDLVFDRATQGHRQERALPAAWSGAPAPTTAWSVVP